MKSNQSEMKKSTSKASLVPAGGGVWVQKKSSSARPVPNNKGLSYFKWTMETTMVLLNECLSKEVWAKEYGDVTRTWAAIAIILKNIPAGIYELKRYPLPKGVQSQYGFVPTR